jgi:hypothetical protein
MDNKALRIRLVCDDQSNNFEIGAKVEIKVHM